MHLCNMTFENYSTPGLCNTFSKKKKKFCYNMPRSTGADDSIVNVFEPVLKNYYFHSSAYTMRYYFV